MPDVRDYMYRVGTVNKFFYDTLYVYLLQVPTRIRSITSGEGLLFTFAKTPAKRGVDASDNKKNTFAVISIL